MAKIRLRDLEITRVALVKRGSNPLADITFYKHHPDSQENSMFKIPKLDRSKLTKEQADALPAILKSLNIEETEVDPNKASTEDILKMLGEPFQKSIQDSIDAAVAEAVKKAKADPPPPPEPKKEDILKDASPAVKAMFEKLEKDAADAKDAADKATKAAKEASDKADIEKERREESEFIKTAEDLVKNLPGTATDNGRLLYRVKKSLSKEDYDALTVLLKAGGEGIQKALDETGHQDSSLSSGSAYERLQKASRDLMAKDDNLTSSKAFVKACEQNPELHAQYNKERQKEKSRRQRGDDDDT